MKRLLYWLDRILNRECWRVVGARGSYVSPWGYRSVAMALAVDWTVGRYRYRIEYAHRPFRRVKIEERHVSQAHTPEAGERRNRRGQEIAAGLGFHKVTVTSSTMFRDALREIAKVEDAHRTSESNRTRADRRAVEFLIESTKGPPPESWALDPKALQSGVVR